MEYVSVRKLEPKSVGHPDHKVIGGTLSPLSIDQYVRTLKGFATWLREKRYTRSNVLGELQKPKVTIKTIEPLTEHEIRRIFATLDTQTAYGSRNYAIILTLLDTGLRCGELCGLKLEDVHLEGKHAYVKVLGKGQKERIVYLGRRTHEALLSYRTFVRLRHEKDPSVTSFFLTIRGTSLTMAAFSR